MIYLIAGYLFLTMLKPWMVWDIVATLRVERIYALTMILAWATAGEKQFIENKVNMAVALMAFAMTVSAILSPYQSIMDNVDYQDWMKAAIIYVLIMSLIKTEKDIKFIVGIFVVGFFLYLAHSYREFLNGRGVYAMGIWRMVGVDGADPNSFGSSINFMLPFIYPMATLMYKKWHYLFIPAYVLLCARCIQLTGSRGSFLVMCCLFLSAAVLSKHRMKAIPALLIAATIFWFTMGDRLQDRIRTLWDPTINESATASAQGRSEGFWGGLEVWGSSPLYGVGPGCYRFAPGKTHYTHCLYGQIPSNLGILGIAGWVGMLCCVGLNHLQMRGLFNELKKRNREKEGAFYMSLSNAIVFSFFLMLGAGLGAHNGFRTNWIWYPAFQATALFVLQNKVNGIKHFEQFVPKSLMRSVAA